MQGLPLGHTVAAFLTWNKDCRSAPATAPDVGDDCRQGELSTGPRTTAASCQPKPLRQLGGAAADQADQERAEAGVGGGHLVEPHLVDDLLDRGEVVGQQGDAPFVVVQAGGTGDELEYPSLVAPAHRGVTAHEAAALLERQPV